MKKDEIVIQCIRLKGGGYRARVVDPDWNPAESEHEDIYREKAASFGASVGRKIREWAEVADYGERETGVEKSDGTDG